MKVDLQNKKLLSLGYSKEFLENLEDELLKICIIFADDSYDPNTFDLLEIVENGIDDETQDSIEINRDMKEYGIECSIYDTRLIWSYRSDCWAAGWLSHNKECTKEILDCIKYFSTNRYEEDENLYVLPFKLEGKIIDKYILTHELENDKSDSNLKLYRGEIPLSILRDNKNPSPVDFMDPLWIGIIHKIDTECNKIIFSLGSSQSEKILENKKLCLNIFRTETSAKLLSVCLVPLDGKDVIELSIK